MDSGDKAEIDISQADSFLIFNSDGTFSIETNNLLLSGTKELRISPRLIEHPNTVIPEETILPLEFITCKLKMQEWTTGDVTVPTGVDAEWVFEEPIITYASP